MGHEHPKNHRVAGGHYEGERGGGLSKRKKQMGGPRKKVDRGGGGDSERGMSVQIHFAGRGREGMIKGEEVNYPMRYSCQCKLYARGAA